MLGNPDGRYPLNYMVRMRQQSKLQIHVRSGKIIGGELPLVCLPLVGDSRAKIVKEAQALTKLQPDLLEWRIDGYDEVERIEACLLLLQEVRDVIGDIPLIFTCRIISEGGLKEISPERRLKLYLAAIATGEIDLVDVELCNDKAFIETIKTQARDNSVSLILSYHNFELTPAESFIYGKLVEARKRVTHQNKMYISE